MMRFATATPAPKPRKPYGLWLGYVAAGILIVFALIHLFRIDTFVPELRYALPFDSETASTVAFVLITAEVFALPVLMRMKLSPLARLIGGFLVVLVPLVWLLIAIWNYGYGVSTAQLGEFYALPSSWLLIVFNALWLGLNFWALWAIGYDMPKRLRK